MRTVSTSAKAIQLDDDSKWKCNNTNSDNDVVHGQDKTTAPYLLAAQ